MKKTIIMITVALMAMTSGAASIKWSISNAAIKDPILNTNLAGAQCYFYLGTTTDAAVLAAFTGETFNSAALSTLLGTGVTALSGGKAVGTTVYANAGISDSVNNAFFCVVVTDGYYKLGTVSQKGYDASNGLASPTTATFTSASFGSWQPVPEPATAALALAGLALLIRRRK